MEMVGQNPESELVALCDVMVHEELKLSGVKVPYYQNLDLMLQNENDIDVVVIATPNALHAPQAEKVLSGGCHVVVEKPLGLKKSEVERLIFTALHKNKHVFGVMQNRYSPPSVWIKDLVDSGILGRINMVQVNCYWNRDERYYKEGEWHGTTELDGGVLYTQFSHFIDILYWLFGDIKDISGRSVNFNHQNSTDFDDSGTVNFSFEQGGIGIINFSTSCWDQNFESSLTILAENGTLKIGGQYMDKVEYCHVKDYKLPDLKEVNPANEYEGYKGSAANHAYVIQNVIDVLKEREAITTNALEGLKVVDIIERIYASCKKA